MEQGKKKNRLIFLINLARILLIIGSMVFIQILKIAEMVERSFPLLILGIIALIYSLVLMFAPFDKIKNKFLGYIFCTIDSIFIFIFIILTGSVASPFVLLFLFPLLSLSILYETVGSTYSVILFTLFTIYLLIVYDYPAVDIANIFVKMALFALFSLYIGNISKELKGKQTISDLKNQIEILKQKLSAQTENK